MEKDAECHAELKELKAFVASTNMTASVSNNVCTEHLTSPQLAGTKL